MKGGDTKRSRNLVPQAFICVLDSVLKADEKSTVSKGQRVRTKGALEHIFAQAGLAEKQQSTETELHSDYNPVVMWVLY